MSRKQISLHLEVEQLERLKALSQETNIPVQRLIRNMIDAHFTAKTPMQANHDCTLIWEKVYASAAP